MLGSIGPVEFTVSEMNVHTFSDMSFSHKASFHEHKIIGRKSLIEFTGHDASTCSLKISLNVYQGNRVQDNIDSIRSLMEDHYPAPFTLGGRVIGSGLWVIESMNVSLVTVDSYGEIFAADINLTLKEHNDDEV